MGGLTLELPFAAPDKEHAAPPLRSRKATWLLPGNYLFSDFFAKTGTGAGRKGIAPDVAAQCGLQSGAFVSRYT